MKTSRLLGAVFAVMLTVAFADNALAVRLGPLDAHPYVGISSTYNDNVFVQPSNEKSDWYFTISPGLLLQMPIRQSAVELEYRADIYRYADTGDTNDVEDHFVRGMVGVNLSGGLSLRVDDFFSKGHESRGDSNAAVIGAVPINKFNSNDLRAEVGYQLSDRFSVSAAYTNFVIDYDLAANSFRDRMDNGADVAVYYKFMPKTSILVEGIYKDISHDQDTVPARSLDSEEYWALAGIRWDVTSKSTGSFKVGYEWKDFDMSGIKDYGRPVFRLSLQHDFTPKTSLTLSGSRQANETDDPAVTYTDTTSGMAKLRFNPITKLFFSPFASLTHSRYSGDSVINGDTGRREDDMWQSGIDATYVMNKWITLNVGYKHTKRASSFTFYDYTDNSVTFGVKATL